MQLPQASQSEGIELSSLIANSARSSDESDGSDDEESALQLQPQSDEYTCGSKLRDVLVLIASFVVTFLLGLFLMEYYSYTFTRSDGDFPITSPEETEGMFIDKPIFPQRSKWENLQWQPNVHPDNCYPGFRLANSTLHCATRDPFVPPITNDSDGRQFCGGIPMKPNYCVLPITGSWALSRSPSPLASKFGITNYTDDDKLLCKTMDQLIDGTAHENGYWIPRSSCHVIPLSPFAWTQHSSCQTTIAMIGDSHVRNLFTATINGLRGVEYFTEAHPDGQAKELGVAESYEWRFDNAGVATDELGFYFDIKANPPQFFEDCQCDKVQRCLRILFIWAPLFAEQVEVFHLVPNDTKLLIVEPGNGYEHDTILDSRWTDRIDKMMNINPKLNLNVIHFVWGNQPAGRVEALVEWTSYGAHASRKSYLKQDQIQFEGLQGRATFHFACGLSQTEAVSDTIAAAEPCEDLTDTAQLRAIITAHFDIFGQDKHKY